MTTYQKRRAVFLIALFLWTPSLVAQDLSAQLDSYLNEKYKATEPGAIALVAKGNDVIYRKAVGMADLENNVAAHCLNHGLTLING